MCVIFPVFLPKKHFIVTSYLTAHESFNDFLLIEKLDSLIINMIKSQTFDKTGMSC